ncbi:MAG: hypothetical protein NVSMB12_15820 [Acidimicrobiales bacterium]
MTSAPPADPATVRPPSLRWWREGIYMAVFYGIYSAVRNTQGSAGAAHATATAFHHARTVIRVERDLWLFHEHRVQAVFVHGRLFMQFWNVFYGTAHFIVTAAAIIWMFRRQPGRYPYWRNVLAIMTGLALIGFAFFPLMPPRLLDTAGGHFGFVDTLVRYGGSWSFDSGAMQKISNQYAAMPSLHFGWSSWCACVFLPSCRSWWTRALAICYPFLTLFAIVVTANHFLLDAAGGATVLGAAVLLARPITSWTAARA